MIIQVLITVPVSTLALYMANFMTGPSFLAIDLGAESGRAILGQIDERLTIEEVHRFSNGPVRVGSHIHWDVLRLWSEIQNSLRIASSTRWLA